MLPVDAGDVAKKLFIKTYGCQMNVYDSDRMAHSLAAHGYRAGRPPRRRRPRRPEHLPHPREGGGEGVFRARASAPAARREARGYRSRDGAGRRRLRGAGRGRAPGRARAVRRYRRRPAGLSSPARAAGAPRPRRPARWSTPSSRSRASSTICPQDQPAGGVSAFLTIQEGCDKFCTFCVVPYTRGAEQSRPGADILREARGLVASGARELTLLGQNVNAYHGDGSGRRHLGARPPAARAGRDPRPRRGCATRPRTRATWTRS